MSYTAFISYSHAADTQLATRLQSVLQRFAKPFYRLRHIRIFRDETNLSLTPQLWTTIQGALRESECFILLASPKAANSTWVTMEIEEWLRFHRDHLDKFMIVLTEGEILWDSELNDFNWSKTTALPAVLKDKFNQVPLYLDFRWAKTSTDLSLRNPEFLKGIGKIAANLHGKQLDDIVGDDVRQYRRFKMVTAAVITLLLSLLAATTGAAYYANQQKQNAESEKQNADAQRRIAEQKTEIAEKFALAEQEARKEAERQTEIGEQRRKEAEQQKRIAENERGRADLKTKEALASAKAERSARQEEKRQREEADRQREEALKQLKISRSRELAATALSKLSLDPELSLLLAQEAIGFSRTQEAEEALKKSMARSNIVEVMGGNSGGVLEGLFVDNGGHLLTTSLNGKVRVWDLKSKRSAEYSTEEVQLGVNTKVLPSVATSPDGCYFVTINKGAQGYYATVRKTSSGSVVKELTGPEQIVSTSFSHDGNFLVTVGNGPGNSVTIRTWDVKTWSCLTKFEQSMLSPGLLPAVSVVISNDGKFVATLGQDLFEFQDPTSQVILVNRDSNKLVRAIRVPMEDHSDFPGHISAISFSPQSDLLAVASEDGATRLYSTSTGELVSMLCGSRGSVNDVSFSADGQLIVTANEGGTADVWRTPHTTDNDPNRRVDNNSSKKDSQQERSDFYVPRSSDAYSDCSNTNEIVLNHSGAVLQVRFSSDGKYVATAGADKSARIWNAQTGRSLAEFRGHQSWINAVAFSRDNKFLITASNDKTARIWLTGINPGQDSEHKFSTSGPQGSTDSIKSNDGRYSMSMCCGGSSIMLSDKSTHKSYTLKHPERVYMWKFNLDGKLALTSSGNTIRIWDTATGENKHVLIGHYQYVHYAAFSPDGKRLVTVSTSGEALVWDVESGSLLSEVDSPVGITRVDFSKTGRFLLAVCNDHTARVWDSVTGTQLETFSGRDDGVIAVDFSDDEKHVFTLSLKRGKTGFDSLKENNQYSTQRYDCELCGSLNEIISVAQKRVAQTKRELNPSERDLYINHH